MRVRKLCDLGSQSFVRYSCGAVLLPDIGKSMSTGRTCNTQEHGHAAKLLIWMLPLDLVPCCPKKVKVILKWLDEIEN